MSRSPALGLLIVCAMATSILADDPPLSLGDLEAYRSALQARDQIPAVAVGFRDLWSHPEAYVGRRVRIEGKVARLFQQPRVGEFPPLAEVWVVNPIGDPICLVFPADPAMENSIVGTSIAFDGTFLRRIPYRGGDIARLAPLIVGANAPLVKLESTSEPGNHRVTADWAMGLIAASAVVLILARRHLSRPPTRPLTSEPTPLFLDSDDGRHFAEKGTSHDGS